MLASVLKMVIVQASLSIYPSVPQHHMHSFDHSLIFMNVPDKYLLIQPNPKIVHSPSFSDICWDKKNHELSSVGVMRPLFVCPSHWLSLRLHLYNLWTHPQGTQIPPGTQCPRNFNSIASCKKGPQKPRNGNLPKFHRVAQIAQFKSQFQHF